MWMTCSKQQGSRAATTQGRSPRSSFSLVVGLGLGLCSGLAQAAAPQSSPLVELKPRTASKVQPIQVVNPETLVQRRLCVWDLMGENGENFAAMKDYQVKAATLGVDFKLKGYIDEKVASADFRAGYCDAVLLTGLRARPYNFFTGSIESVGSIPDYEHMRTLLSILSQPSAAKLMNTELEGQRYEVAGVLPFGRVFGFVNDRSIKSPEALIGKKIAVFDYDKAQAQLIKELRAVTDPSDVTNFASKFNDKQVDVVISPAIAYRSLELYKGMGQKGGVVNLVLAQVSLQLLTHPERFPEDFGVRSREYVFSLFDRQLKMLRRYESDVPESAWISISEPEHQRYIRMGQQARQSMVDEKTLDPRMLTLLKKIRCQKKPALSECSQTGY